MENKQHIISLFNCGKLKSRDAVWYKKQGYAFICKGKMVVDIVLEK